MEEKLQAGATPQKAMHLAYRPDIDGLRAIAVLSVLCFHAFPNWVKGGFIGVDVFFVISGFLISSILFKSLESKTPRFFWDFYKKRAKRIFPALLLVLASSLLFGWFALFPEEYKELASHVSAGSGFVSNFLLWHETGYFDKMAETKPMLHLWSLGIEEQFYLIWPFLLWFAFKKKRNLLALTLGIMLLSFVLNVFSIHTHATATFYSPFTRFWELLCGGLLAYLKVYPPKLKKFKATGGLKNVFACLGLGTLLLSIGLFSKGLAFPGALALVPVLGALLLMASETSLVNRLVLSHPLLVWFGLISYPLYLWHWPLLSFASIIVGDLPDRNVRLVVVFLSVFLAWMTYLWIEKPIRRGLGEKRTVGLLFGLLFAMACFGFYFKHVGNAARFEHLSALKTIMVPPAVFKAGLDCKKAVPALKNSAFNVCLVSKASEPEILVLGDSHANHYRDALWEQLPAKSILVIAEFSCLPFATEALQQGECQKKFEAVLAFLQSNRSIKTVYLSGYWAYLMSGGFDAIGWHWRHAKALSTKSRESFLKNGRLLLATALKAHKQVVFLKDIPDLNFSISTCLTRPLHLPFQTVNYACAMGFKPYETRMKIYDATIQQLLKEFPQVSVYSPRHLFCNEKTCLARDDSFPYYYDGDHLNYYGANKVIGDMIHTLKKA